MAMMYQSDCIDELFPELRHIREIELGSMPSETQFCTRNEDCYGHLRSVSSSQTQASKAMNVVLPNRLNQG